MVPASVTGADMSRGGRPSRCLASSSAPQGLPARPQGRRRSRGPRVAALGRAERGVVVVVRAKPKVRKGSKAPRPFEISVERARTTARRRKRGDGDDGGKSNTNEGKEEGSPAQTQTVTVVGGPGLSKGAAASSRKILFRRIVRRLANLKFAIGEIAVLAFMSALGTALEQNKAPDYYTSQLVEGHPIASDILGNVVLLLGFDHMYSSPLYLGLCALLTSSLMACSYNTQWPMVKVAQRWRFIEDPARVLKMSASHSIAASSEGPSPTSGALAVKKASSVLRSKGYETFVKPAEDGRGEVLYAFKGLSGKFAPIGVHVSMVLVVLGASVSTTCGWHGSVMIEEGKEAPVREAMAPNSVLARLAGRPYRDEETGREINLRLNDFKIDYYPDGKVEQFYSDLSVTEGDGGSDSRPEFTKLISVNNPLRFGSLTAYQTDWAVSGATVEVRVDSNAGGILSGAGGQGEDAAGRVEEATATTSDSFEVFVPMVSLEGRLGEVGGRIWGGVLPVFVGGDGLGSSGDITNFTLVARDLQNVGVYGPDGQFKGIRRPGSNRELEVGPVTIKVLSLSSSSGLELKSDPGVPIVYTGFAFLMLTTVLSYVSHSQVWAHGSEDGELAIGGTTNRAKKEFQNEVGDVVRDLKAQLQG